LLNILGYTIILIITSFLIRRDNESCFYYFTALSFVIYIYCDPALLTLNENWLFAWINFQNIVTCEVHMSFTRSHISHQFVVGEKHNRSSRRVHILRILPSAVFRYTYVSCLSHVCHENSWRIGAPHDDSWMHHSVET